MPAANPSLLERAFRHLMSFGFCVGFPAAVMLALPVMRTTFTRSNGTVSAAATRMVYFIIPFSTERVENVTAVDGAWIRGSTRPTTRSGPANDPKRPETRSEDMGYLTISSPGGSLEIPASPAMLDSTRRQVRDFLEDESRPELRLWTVANWKISIGVAGFLSLLTVVYLGSLVRSFAGRGQS